MVLEEPQNRLKIDKILSHKSHHSIIFLKVMMLIHFKMKNVNCSNSAIKMTIKCIKKINVWLCNIHIFLSFTTFILLYNYNLFSSTHFKQIILIYHHHARYIFIIKSSKRVGEQTRALPRWLCLASKPPIHTHLPPYHQTNKNEGNKIHNMIIAIIFIMNPMLKCWFVTGKWATLL